MSRLINVTVWIAAAGMCSLVVSIIADLGGGIYYVPIVQSLTPYLLLPAFPFAAWANVRRRWTLAVAHGVIALSLLALLAPVTLRTAPTIPTGASTISVMTMNALYSTSSDERIEQVLRSSADVAVIQEYTPALDDALHRGGIARRYPFASRAPAWGARGIAIYSTRPLVEVVAGPLNSANATRATIFVEGVPIRLIVVHPVPPTSRGWGATWAPDLDAIREEATSEPGAVVIAGDFNATRWHPPFRRLLAEFDDVHETLGRGLSTSWPIGWSPLGSGVLARAVESGFVRIDHVLVSEHLLPVSITEFEPNGSDHRAFAVTLALR